MFPARGDNTKLGKGSLLLDLLDEDTGLPLGLEFTGNASAISIASDTTFAELYSSTQKSASLVARARTKVAFTVTATLNEYTLTNLKLFLLGEEATSSQSLQTSGTKTLTDVKKGKYYEIGARRVTDVTVSNGTDPLTLNVDYQLNSEYGTVYIRPTGNVADGDDLTVEFDAPALTISKVRIGKAAAQIGRLVYLADDANSNGASAKDRLELWKVDVAPDGELNLISDEYGSFNLTMAVLADEEGHPDEPYGVLERATAA
jgi:hypothetical protein